MKKTAAKAAPARGRGAERPAAQPGGGAAAEEISRILVGVRIEPRLVKVMKALAELHDCALGELIEKVFWAAMEGGNAFAERNGRSSVGTRQQIQSLKSVYGVTYSLEDLTRPKERRSSGAASD